MSFEPTSSSSSQVDSFGYNHRPSATVTSKYHSSAFSEMGWNVSATATNGFSGDGGGGSNIGSSKPFPKLLENYQRAHQLSASMSTSPDHSVLFPCAAHSDSSCSSSSGESFSLWKSYQQQQNTAPKPEPAHGGNKLPLKSVKREYDDSIYDLSAYNASKYHFGAPTSAPPAFSTNTLISPYPHFMYDPSAHQSMASSSSSTASSSLLSSLNAHISHSMPAAITSPAASSLSTPSLSQHQKQSAESLLDSVILQYYSSEL